MIVNYKSIVWLFKPSLQYLETQKPVWWYSRFISFFQKQFPYKFKEEWEAMPWQTNNYFENRFQQKISGLDSSSNVGYLPPFFYHNYQNTLNVNFANMTFHLNDPEITGIIARKEKDIIKCEREKIDKECGVNSLSPCSNPFGSGGADPLSKKEMLIISLSAAIREKPDWELKYKNEDIQRKWREELREQCPEVDNDMLQYVFDELEYYISQQHGKIKPATVQGVWQADHLISEDLRKALLFEVSKLENVPENERDWHPGSNGQVLDLVHPSLYPLISGVTSVYNFSDSSIKVVKLSKDEEIQQLTKEIENKSNNVEEMAYKEDSLLYFKLMEDDSCLSKKYQWLPSDVKVDNNGNATFLSYINNLDPGVNQPLYTILSQILTSFIPMFESVLTDLNDPRPKRYDPYPWYEEDEYVRDRKVILRPLLPFTMPPSLTKVSLKGRRLQVIVKLANIVLTPENPKYAGGVWHVEGMKNENIVSSGIYYYDSVNLQFRAAIVEPYAEQNDDAGVEEVYGLSANDLCNQEMGYVVTKTDRCIAFPNEYQHKVAPFQLSDPSKSGVRKILVFFLVDPATYIPSSFNIPPQQVSWKKEETIRECKPWNSFDSQILKKIVKIPSLNLDDAKKHREELMKERKFFIEQDATYSFERPFSLCEH